MKPKYGYILKDCVGGDKFDLYDSLELAVRYAGPTREVYELKPKLLGKYTVKERSELVKSK